jgi:hypothetical protein
MNIWLGFARGGALAHVTAGPLMLALGVALGMPVLVVFGAISLAVGAWVLWGTR